MKNSPIKLNSSSKSKLKVTKSPESKLERSNTLYSSIGNRSSVHTIPTKESPKCNRKIESHFTN